MEKNTTWRSLLGPDFYVDLYKTAGKISQETIRELEKIGYPMDFLSGYGEDE